MDYLIIENTPDNPAANALAAIQGPGGSSRMYIRTIERLQEILLDPNGLLFEEVSDPDILEMLRILHALKKDLQALRWGSVMHATTDDPAIINRMVAAATLETRGIDVPPELKAMVDDDDDSDRDDSIKNEQ